VTASLRSLSGNPALQQKYSSQKIKKLKKSIPVLSAFFAANEIKILEQ
jgi:hypothetical protein